MKKIWKYLQSYFKEEIKPAYFICVVLLVAIGVYVEYTYDIERNFVYEYFWEVDIHFARTLLVYFVPFGGSYLLYIVFYKRYDLLKNRRFIALFFFALFVYCFRSSWFQYRIWVEKIASPETYYYAMRVTNQLAQGSLLFIPLVLWWVIFHRRQMPLYGFSLKSIDLRPYLWMLVIMMPLVAWASFQSDFLRTYPVYQRIVPEGFSTTTGVIKILFFELCYGFDFVMTEFFFRGFLILAFAPIVGRACILPMVAFYVFIHFGKPLGETISSFFGGLALGVIAYETRSIIGGIIAHLGTAWMMETGGTFGRELQLDK